MAKAIPMSKELKEFVKYFDETREIINVLYKDHIKYSEYSASCEDNVEELQFWARIGIRILAIFIDALLYRLKMMAKKAIKLTGKKKPFPRKKKEKLRFTLKELAVAFNSDFETHISDEDLEKFFRDTDIRNHITHPRKLEDLNVSAKEFLEFNNAFKWLSEAVFLKISKDFKKRRKQQKKQ